MQDSHFQFILNMIQSSLNFRFQSRQRLVTIRFLEASVLHPNASLRKLLTHEDGVVNFLLDYGRQVGITKFLREHLNKTQQQRVQFFIDLRQIFLLDLHRLQAVA